MITAIVGAIICIMLIFIAVWLFSPSFRRWAETPKYILLERDELFESANVENK